MSQPAVMIINCRIIDGTGRAPIDNGRVILRGDRIVDVGPDHKIGALPKEEARIFDARSGTLLPGLIDMHVHLTTLSALEREAGFTPHRVARDITRIASLLGRVVCSGITTLRDCGFPHHGIFALRESLEAGELLGPRLILCGRSICATGGHGDSLSVQADGVDQVRAAVRGEIRAGADWIKLMATGGTATPGERTLDVQFTVDEMAAAVDEALRRGKKTCAHCSCLAGARASIAAGVHGIEHGIELDSDTANVMVEQQVVFVPTLACTRIEAEAGPESGIAEFTRVRAIPAADSQARSFEMAISAGVTVATGTDAGPFYLPIGMPSLIKELEMMRSLGMPPMKALEATTRVPAETLGLGQKIGTVEPGKLADLLIVSGDPLADVSVLAYPQAVFQSGNLIFSDSRF